MKAITQILVPIDFSVTAQNAFAYAKTLALSFNAKIKLVHISEVMIPVSDMTIAPLIEVGEEVVVEAMRNFINENVSKDTHQPIITSEIIKGDPLDTLVELSKSSDLIVMGTTGLQDFLTKIIGSTSLDLANKAHCPVILVPRNARWQRIEFIMFASSSESATPTNVKRITDLANLMGASVHFVHIEENVKGDDKVIDTIWDELFSVSDPSLAFEIHTINGGDKIRQLKEYSEKNKISLMAFVSKHRSFWQNLMHHSVTQNMVISTDIPMVVMHLDDAE